MSVAGYFTTERNIVGLNTDEIERALGLRPGRLDRGARILELVRRPTLDEFELGGSTRYAGRKGLTTTNLSPRRIPMAWTSERLVKVDPVIRHTPLEEYPAAPGQNAAEQWVLKAGVQVAAREVCLLQRGETYWPPRVDRPK